MSLLDFLSAIYFAESELKKRLWPRNTKKQKEKPASLAIVVHGQPKKMGCGGEECWKPLYYNQVQKTNKQAKPMVHHNLIGKDWMWSLCFYPWKAMPKHCNTSPWQCLRRPAEAQEIPLTIAPNKTFPLYFCWEPGPEPHTAGSRGPFCLRILESGTATRRFWRITAWLITSSNTAAPTVVSVETTWGAQIPAPAQLKQKNLPSWCQ